MSSYPEAPNTEGSVDGRFDAVRDAFVENFVAHGEIGAAVCVVVENRVVADLWAGWADETRTRSWERDTLVNAFSVGKGLVALCAARLAGEGRLDPDATVETYWPGFARNGKADITVAHLLSHQAGLPAIRKPLPDNAMLDWSVMTAALEEETPWWVPGTAHGYHVNTFGFLVGEVIRRITGRSIGAYLRNEITEPLGADLFIGLPTSEHDRVAHMHFPAAMPAPSELPEQLDDEQLMTYNAYANPPQLSGAGVLNTPAWRSVEIPSANCHATARGVARVYQALAHRGSVDGIEIVTSDALALAATEQVNGEDLVLHRPSRFGLGFQLTQPERPLGPNPGAFGHFGAGGSLGFCDPDAGVAFGYVMNEMGPRWQNPRNKALVDAVYECL